MDYQEYIDTLICWAADKGYCIEFCNDGGNDICPVSKTIEIDDLQPQKMQLICLLHECGHVLIYENGSTFNFKSIEGMNDSSTDVSYRVNRVIEEAEAWRRGRNLSKRLGFKIEKEEWDAERIKALQNYINWASNTNKK